MNYDLSALPLLPLRGTVVFPKVVTHLDIGREKSIKAVESAMAGNRLLVVLTQKDELLEDPELGDLYEVGTLVKIKQLLRLPGGFVRILVTGLERVKAVKLLTTESFYLLESELIEDIYEDDIEIEAYSRHCRSKFEEWAKLTKAINEEALIRLQNISDVSELTDYITSIAPVTVPTKQTVLEATNIGVRLQKVLELINVEIEIADLEHSLNNQVRQQMEKSQKEYFLREKIKAIHDELGDNIDPETEVEDFKKTLKKLQLSKEVEERIYREIIRFERMPQMMPEATIVRNYLEWVLGLPWNEKSEDRLDIKEAAAILDEEHYGLEKVKDRILEFLAVHHLTNHQAGSILCFIGPPGVGKTSLASSIARAMNRKFVRASLGGVRDEAEIRGHRRTYIGAMPGRMIQGLKHAGTKNPVYLLDEIDKLASDYKGDPSSALLEVLDPEQNNTFSDHFIEIPFDFSEVFWITTANVISDIPRPLLDRMEVIELSGYTEEEKMEIAKRYLVPKQIKKHGLTSKQIKFSDSVLKRIISEYTLEAGVRTLEKTIAKVCRKVACSVVADSNNILKVNLKALEDILGAPIYLEGFKERKNSVGLVHGLAWTSVGGTVLPCEVSHFKGSGKLILTGRLGDVMKESAQAALSYIRKNAKVLHLEENFYEKSDVHIHLPEGATPKDGPSAGITMTLAIVSSLTNRKVRADVAMTGEITIRGNVLPIGGLKEKILAAHRYGIKEVLIPIANQKDLREIPASVRNDLIITPVKTMDEVLAKALI